VCCMGMLNDNEQVYLQDDNSVSGAGITSTHTCCNTITSILSSSLPVSPRGPSGIYSCLKCYSCNHCMRTYNTAAATSACTAYNVSGSCHCLALKMC
jgi:hypothetical protein